MNSHPGWDATTLRPLPGSIPKKTNRWCRAAELALNHRCGGHARCGTCVITVEAGATHLAPVGAAEARILKVLKAGPDQRLGCQAWAQGDVTCRID